MGLEQTICNGFDQDRRSELIAMLVQVADNLGLVQGLHPGSSHEPQFSSLDGQPTGLTKARVPEHRHSDALWHDLAVRTTGFTAPLLRRLQRRGRSATHPERSQPPCRERLSGFRSYPARSPASELANLRQERIGLPGQIPAEVGVAVGFPCGSAVYGVSFPGGGASRLYGGPCRLLCAPLFASADGGSEVSVEPGSTHRPRRQCGVQRRGYRAGHRPRLPLHPCGPRGGRVVPGGIPRRAASGRAVTSWSRFRPAWPTGISLPSRYRPRCLTRTCPCPDPEREARRSRSSPLRFLAASTERAASQRSARRSRAPCPWWTGRSA